MGHRQIAAAEPQRGAEGQSVDQEAEDEGEAGHAGKAERRRHPRGAGQQWRARISEGHVDREAAGEEEAAGEVRSQVGEERGRRGAFHAEAGDQGDAGQHVHRGGDGGQPEDENGAAVEEDEVRDAIGALDALRCGEQEHGEIAGGEFRADPVEQGPADRDQADQHRQLNGEDQTGRRGGGLTGAGGADMAERARDDGGQQAVEALPDLADRGADLPRHAVNAGRAFAEEQADQIEIEPASQRIGEIAERREGGFADHEAKALRRKAIGAEAEGAETLAGADQGIDESAERAGPIADDQSGRLIAERPGEGRGGEAGIRLDDRAGPDLMAHPVRPAGRGEQQIEQALAEDHRGEQKQGGGGVAGERAGREQGDHKHQGQDAGQARQRDEHDAVEHDVRRAAAAFLLVEQFEELPLHAGAADGDGELDDGDGDGEGAEQGDAEQPPGHQHEEQAGAEADQEAERGRTSAFENQTLGGGAHFALVSEATAVDQALCPDPRQR